MIEPNGIKLSMDSKGRALNNIWIERFWRTIKYQEIYLKEYKTVNELYTGIEEYIYLYNSKQGHRWFCSKTTYKKDNRRRNHKNFK